MADTLTEADSNSIYDSSMAEGGPISDTSSTGGRRSVNFQTPSSTTPRKNIPEPNLERAYHTIDFLQRNPQWLSNPYTTHAANALLANSSRMIEQSIQLQRVGTQAASVKLTNDFTKKRQDALSSISQFVPMNDTEGQGELGRLNAMATKAGTPDFNLEEFSRGVAALESKYSPAGKADSLTMSDGSVLQGYRDKYGNFHQSQIQVNEAKDKAVLSHIEKRLAGQKEMQGIRFQDQKELMRQKELWASLRTEEKNILNLYQKDYDSANRMIENLQKAGVTETDPRMIAAKINRGLVAERQRNFLEAGRPEVPTPTPAATQPSAPSQSPYKEGTRLTGPGGKIYVVKDGQPVPE